MKKIFILGWSVLFLFASCTNTLNTVPKVQADKNKIVYEKNSSEPSTGTLEEKQKTAEIIKKTNDEVEKKDVVEEKPQVVDSEKKVENKKALPLAATIILAPILIVGAVVFAVVMIAGAIFLIDLDNDEEKAKEKEEHGKIYEKYDKGSPYYIKDWNEEIMKEKQVQPKVKEDGKNTCYDSYGILCSL